MIRQRRCNDDRQKVRRRGRGSCIGRKCLAPPVQLALSNTVPPRERRDIGPGHHHLGHDCPFLRERPVPPRRQRLERTRRPRSRRRHRHIPKITNLWRPQPVRPLPARRPSPDGYDGTTVSTASLVGSTATFKTASDYNGNRISDILFRNAATGDTGFDQVNANGTLQGWRSICSSNTSYAVAGTGDYNGDGISDVLFRNNATGNMGFCQLNSNGTLQGWHALGGSVTSYGVF